MKTQNHTRTFLTVVFGAIALIAIVAAAPKADASPNNVRLNPGSIYRVLGLFNNRTRDRALYRLQWEPGATQDLTPSVPMVLAGELPESKGPRRLPRVKGGFFDYKGKH